MVCPAVLEREHLVQGKGFKMQQKDFFFFVRFCLIITAVEWLAKVRNLLFPLSALPNQASEGMVQTNAISFFFPTS